VCALVPTTRALLRWVVGRSRRVSRGQARLRQGLMRPGEALRRGCHLCVVSELPYPSRRAPRRFLVIRAALRRCGIVSGVPAARRGYAVALSVPAMLLLLACFHCAALFAVCAALSATSSGGQLQLVQGANGWRATPPQVYSSGVPVCISRSACVKRLPALGVRRFIYQARTRGAGTDCAIRCTATHTGGCLSEK
jgi:hypothetical protein